MAHHKHNPAPKFNEAKEEAAEPKGLDNPKEDAAEMKGRRPTLHLPQKPPVDVADNSPEELSESPAVEQSENEPDEGFKENIDLNKASRPEIEKYLLRNHGARVPASMSDKDVKAHARRLAGKPLYNRYD